MFGSVLGAAVVFGVADEVVAAAVVVVGGGDPVMGEDATRASAPPLQPASNIDAASGTASKMVGYFLTVPPTVMTDWNGRPKHDLRQHHARLDAAQHLVHRREFEPGTEYSALSAVDWFVPLIAASDVLWFPAVHPCHQHKPKIQGRDRQASYGKRGMSTKPCRCLLLDAGRFQSRSDSLELNQSRIPTPDDLGGVDFRRGQVTQVFEGLVARPGDVEGWLALSRATSSS
jgi:hypothetical protein